MTLPECLIIGGGSDRANSTKVNDSIVDNRSISHDPVLGSFDIILRVGKARIRKHCSWKRIKGTVRDDWKNKEFVEGGILSSVWTDTSYFSLPRNEPQLKCLTVVAVSYINIIISSKTFLT